MPQTICNRSDGQHQSLGGRPDTRPLSIALAIGALTSYLLVVPLLLPRGPYLWGHYRLMDLYAGIPLALIAAGFAVVLASRPPRRPVAFRVGVALASTFLAVLALEATYTLVYQDILRWDYWFHRRWISRATSLPDPELGYRRKPRLSFTGRANRYTRPIEFRADEHGFRNPPGIRRAEVVFVGDSVTEAVEVPDETTFARRASRALNRPMVNLGVGGYGPQQDLAVLRRYGLAYRPRLVVWQVTAGNDLADARQYAAWRREPDAWAEPLKVRYVNHSWFGGLLRRTVETHRPPAVDYRDPQAWDNAPLVADEPDGFAETRDALTEAARLCRSHGITLLVVMLFSRGDRPGDFTSAVRDLCHGVGCSFLDLSPALRQAACDGRPVFFL